MTHQQDTAAIRIIHPVCCGLDVHKEKISACLMTIDEQGHEESEIREFGTFTDELVKLRGWLQEIDCPISNPCFSRLASHLLSAMSVFRPGTFLM